MRDVSNHKSKERFAKLRRDHQPTRRFAYHHDRACIKGRLSKVGLQGARCKPQLAAIPSRAQQTYTLLFHDAGRSTPLAPLHAMLMQQAMLPEQKVYVYFARDLGPPHQGSDRANIALWGAGGARRPWPGGVYVYFARDGNDVRMT